MLSVTMVEVEILDEEEFLDRTDETRPIPKVLVTYRIGNTMVDSFSIDAAKWKVGNQEALVMQAMKDSKKQGVRSLNV
jgi:hypothetical protein